MKFCQAIGTLWEVTAVIGVLAFAFLGFMPWAPLGGESALTTTRIVILAGYFGGGVLLALIDFWDCINGQSTSRPA